MIVIPVRNDPSHELSIVLNGISYTLKFIWNTRFEYWSMNISDRDKNPIIQGIKIVPNYALIDQITIVNIPNGDFYAVRSEPESKEVIGIDSFSSGVFQLLFLTEEEFGAL